MRAVTVRQPFASLLMAPVGTRGRKPFETRGFRPQCVAIGDELAIHAAVAPADGFALRSWAESRQSYVTGRSIDRLPYGVILGLARLVEVLPADAVPRRLQRWGDYSKGRWAWRLEPTLLLNPGVVCRGAQGIWTVPPQVEAYLLTHRQSVARARRGAA